LVLVNIEQIKPIVEGLIFASEQPISIDQLLHLLEEEGDTPPPREVIKSAIETLKSDYEERGIELAELASGYQFRVRSSLSQWLQKLWQERPPRYSRALLETLALIAYRQPVTRGEIEEVRGVAVSSNIIRTLLEREWVRVVGYKDVPGKPAMYATTKQFLDYFNLKTLSQLPTLTEFSDLDDAGEQLEIELQQGAGQDAEFTEDDTPPQTEDSVSDVELSEAN
jgi:segregation and condensation protein B